MKRIFASLAALVMSTALGQSAEYTVFRICEDQHVLKTSDGADAGHVQYVVIDPGEQRIVSTIVTGGVLQDRVVALPASSLRFGTSREVVIENITRERLVSAPVIEQTQITQITSGRFEPTLVERSYQHFGVEMAVGRTRRSVEAGASIDRTRTDVNVSAEAGRRPRDGQAAEATGRMRDRAANAGDQPNQAGANSRDLPGPNNARTGDDAERAKERVGRAKAGEDQPSGSGANKERSATKSTRGGESDDRNPVNKERSGTNQEGTSASGERGEKRGEGTRGRNGAATERSSASGEGSDKASSPKREEGAGSRGSSTRSGNDTKEGGSGSGSTKSGSSERSSGKPASSEKKSSTE